MNAGEHETSFTANGRHESIIVRRCARRAGEKRMRTMICVGLIVLLAGCIPIGIRGSTQYAAVVVAMPAT